MLNWFSLENVFRTTRSYRSDADGFCNFACHYPDKVFFWVANAKFWRACYSVSQTADVVYGSLEVTSQDHLYVFIFIKRHQKSCVKSTRKWTYLQYENIAFSSWGGSKIKHRRPTWVVCPLLSWNSCAENIVIKWNTWFNTDSVKPRY